MITAPHIQRRHLLLAGAAAAVAAGILAASGGGGVAPDVSVAGIDLGVPAARARAEIAARGRALVHREVRVVSGRRTVTVVRPADLGASPLVDLALRQAREATPGRVARAIRWATRRGPVRVPLRARYRPGALDAWVAMVAARVDRAPVAASLAAAGERVAVRPARRGLRVRRDALRRALRGDLSGLPAVLAVPVRTIAPAVTTAQAERAAASARGVLTRPATISVEGVVRRIPAPALTRALRLGGAGVVLDAGALRPELSRLYGRVERAPVSASFATDGVHVRVVPSHEGLRVDARAAAAGLARATRPVRVGLVRVAPSRSTAEARALAIRERIGGATTPFVAGLPRVTNVTRGAALLDGTIVPAGGRLSLNAVLGRRTEDSGFVRAPMIVGDLDVDSVGGGVSQIATTLYDAALAAGLTIVRRTPHRLYIGRYPAGRDATISWPEPDLVIRNDWPAAVLVRAAASADRLTVNLYSRALGRRVEIETGSPFARTAPPTRRVVDRGVAAGAAPRLEQAGEPGFSVTFTRTVLRDGALLRRERVTTTYAPTPRVVLVPAGTPGAVPPPTAP